jgi:taurine dehydrogenase small subunit
MPDVTTSTDSDIATPELMKAISEAFNSRDVDRIASFFTEDATFWLARGPEPVGRTLRGRKTIRDTLAARFKVIPDMRWDHKEYIFAGNRAISVWTVKGKGADGEDLNYQGCDIYTFRGGKICAKDTYWKIVEHKDRL